MYTCWERCLQEVESNFYSWLQNFQYFFLANIKVCLSESSIIQIILRIYSSINLNIYSVCNVYSFTHLFFRLQLKNFMKFLMHENHSITKLIIKLIRKYWFTKSIRKNMFTSWESLFCRRFVVNSVSKNNL